MLAHHEKEPIKKGLVNELMKNCFPRYDMHSHNHDFSRWITYKFRRMSWELAEYDDSDKRI